MKKKIFTTLFVAFSLLLAKAQNPIDSTEVSLSIINTEKSDLEIVKDFHRTASPYFKDPKAPRFLLYDRQKKVAFGIGGIIRVRTAYNFSGISNSSSGFVPYSISVPTNSAEKNDFKINTNKSTLFFKLMGDNSKIGKYMAYVSGNFSGNNNNFTLKDAYVSFLGFTIGQTWSTFNDIAAVPPTVDYQGPNGAAMMRTGQIRYTHKLNDQISFAVAVEQSQSTGTYENSLNEKTTQSIPDIPLYIQYSWGKDFASHIRVSGVMKNINYRNLVKDKTETETALGVQLSTKVGITPLIEFYGQINYGNGIAPYINDLSGHGLSIVNNPNHDGRMYALEAMGWFSQVKFNLSKNVFTSLGYSQAKIFPKSGTFSDQEYRYGQYLVGNVFYNITNNIQLGAEYLWGNRVNMGGQSSAANCIQTLVKFNF
ncbi:hypothetical protein ETU09_00730 [Apibacter muscae]|uniref:Porin n=1 Tax=Apibacter muscae TaxID=2509004 RepID=A0A563DKD0_9FLAO|nr:DcaP family trimeric outer membrane transporter [Apibacter muscae]TWP30559.1 hypothetical protein ETU09_00730 [Apibacter muscae]